MHDTPNPFDYYVILDFEATCDQGKAPKPQEIIEFPSVLMCGKTFKIIDEFTSYVRPLHHPQLTKFCTELTGITQQQVENAPLFPEVMTNHMDWLHHHNLQIHPKGSGSSFAFITCGDWDLRSMLPNQWRACEPPLRAIPYAYRQWINIKVHYMAFRETKRAPGMAGMMRALELELVGHHHSGIDDSRNIARIAQHLGERGVSLGITHFVDPPVNNR